MNSHIFTYRPGGPSMEEALARAGHEVWAVNMRRQGGSARAHRHAPGPSLSSYANEDLPAAIRAALTWTETSATKLVLIGVSLGGSISYAYLGGHPDAPVEAVVAIGSPLKWQHVHPVVRVAFASRRIAGWVPVTGARRAARIALPTLGRFTPLLTPYVNTSRIDMSEVAKLVATVEDPPRSVNRELARWIKNGDLVVEGLHVGDSLRRLDAPLLLVLANRDGIVPECAALAAIDAWGSADVEVIRAGDEVNWYAHADPFIAPDAQERVFDPIARWLRKQRQCSHPPLGETA